MRECRKPSAGPLWWMLWFVCLIATPLAHAEAGRTARHWWKGSLYTHSFRSDGDHFPEMVVQWYKQQVAFDEYLAGFGAGGVETGKDVAFEDNTLTVPVDPDPDATYTIRFIGTHRGCDLTSHEATNAEGITVRTTRIYGPQVGTVPAESQGMTAADTLQDEEMYVRAKVISSGRNAKSHVPDEYESAWVQPVVAK